MRAVIAFNMASYYPRLQFLNVISGKQAKWLKRQKQLDISWKISWRSTKIIDEVVTMTKKI
ncbi:hypothetical protein Hdeb2414_s0567g00917721 [Helianthus debilis subsp. tardiflorus]